MGMFRFNYRRLYLSSIITGILLVSFVATPLLTLVQPALSAPEDWWNTEWLFRKEITIDHTKAGAALENFSVLIDVIDSDLANKAQLDGDDVVFTDSDGVQLEHEIELYDSATGHLVAWVNVPSLSSTTDTVLYMYYGNPAAENQENVTAVWDPRYVMVQHLNEKSNPHHCRLWGMIADSLPEDVVLDHLINLQYSLKNLGVLNDDGWGLAYYNDTEATVLRGEPPANVDPNFDLAAQELAGSGARIGVGHVRAAAVGATEIPNPHPFMRYKNDKWWAFGHNGVLSKSILKNLIGPEYLAENQPTVGDDWDDPDVIDSDLYMLYILKCIEENDWNVLMGIAKAVVDISQADSGNMNFFLTDGKVLWGFRKGARTLCYYHSLSPQYSALASQYPTSSQDGWVWLDDYNLVELTREGAPRIIEDIRELPWISAPSPSNGTTDVPVALSELSFNVTDYQGDFMDYYVSTSPNIGSDSAISVGDGRYTVPISGLDYSTTYTWHVNVTDGTYWTNETFTFTTEEIQLLVDSEFDDSVDSDDLRADGAGQDWYESRNDDPGLLTLDTSDVGGDATKKAGLKNYGIASNAYLTQGFISAQTDTFSVSFDIYIDKIEDSGTYDRTGLIYIGDDSILTNAPTGTSNERFVFMAFYDPTPGDAGNDLEIRARTSSGQSYGTTSQWAPVATGLSYDTWYTVTIVVDVDSGTYDVYVDGVLVGNDVPKYGGYTSSSITHISFSADSDGRGDFYVDNVMAPAQDRYKLILSVVGSGSVDVDPGEATYAEGTEVTLTAVPDAGWIFSEWSGDLTGAENPTTIAMDGDKTVIVSFTEELNDPPVVLDPEPADMAIDVLVSMSLLNFTISDADSDLMNYYVSTSPAIGSDSALGESDGTYSLAVSVLEYGTPYTWWVNVTDGTDWTNVTFTFTIESAPHKHYDSTSNGNDGTVYDGVVMGATGKIDGADIFDGTSGYVEVPHDNTITGFTEGFTASVWVKLDTIARRQTILNKYDTAGSQRGWLLDYRNLERVFAFFASADGVTYQWWYADFAPQAGVWYHVAVVWEANAIPEFYINGQQVPTVRSGTVSQIYNNTGAPLDIGRSTYAGRYLDGILDEIRLSDTARTAAWITTCFNNQEDPASFYTIGDEESCVEAPWISDENPRNGVTGVPVSLSELSFNVTDHQGDLMDYYVSTSPDIGSESAINVGNGRYAVLISGLDYSMTYTWRVDVTDGIYWTNETYTFTTEAFINHPPTHDNPLLVSSNGTDTTVEDLTCYNQTTYDPDGDKVTNIYHWYENGASLTNLLMPFDTNSSTTTKDYSGHDNHGTIYGAEWTSNGVVGGAYTLDGSNDYIEVSDSDSLDGAGSWPQLTLEIWIKLSANQNGRRIIAKRYSYQVGFQTSGSANRLYFAVWNDGYYEVEYSTLSVDVWYHIVCTYAIGVGSKIYINGTDVSVTVTDGSASGNIQTSDSPFEVGRRYDIGTSYFAGVVDNLRLYPQALMPKQIHQRYLESKDGLSNSSTIVSQETSFDQVWQCEVIPTDGKQDGAAKLSNTITIAPAPPILSLKWVQTGPYGFSGVLIADITGNDLEEIVHVGQGQVVVLNGTDGSIIWQYYNSGIISWVQPQMADLNKDGILEIVVTLYSTGLLILHGNNGSIYWSITGLGGGEFTSSPVIADIDGDGYPTIFVAGSDIWEPYEGQITALSHDGQVLYHTFMWRACSGGLSIGDTDNDGEFELYVGDRHMYYSDAGLGRGVRSFWAKNLTLRWEVPDVLCSSNIPMLIDVNGDDILDVIAVHHRGGIVVLNSHDGSPIKKDLSLNPLYVCGHYQSSVYDIDGDGNLEIMLADGEHTSTTEYIVVWDLVEWREDARLYVGRCWYAPQVADVTGDGVMDLVACSYSGIHIFDNTFTLIDEINGLFGPLNYAVVQDIDGDGLNEIVVSSQMEKIYAFDTPAPRSNPRARSEVQFYSERRLGVAEYVPLAGRPEPLISDPAPSHLATDVPVSLSELSFNLTDFQGDLMNYTLTTIPDIGSGSGTNVGNGRYTFTIGNLSSLTTYTWTISVTDGVHWETKTFKFTTEAIAGWWDTQWSYRKEVIIDHSKAASELYEFPVLINIVDDDLAGKAQLDGSDIVFTDGQGTKLSHEIEFYDGTTGHLIVWVRVPMISSTVDTKLYMYYGNSAAENQQDPEGLWNSNYMAVYHMNEASGVHYDSTSNANDGTVYGATRGIVGKVDGAYSLDGVDDYIMVPHSGTLTGFTEGLTLSVWVQLDTLAVRQTIINKYNTAGNQRGWLLDYRNQEQVFAFFASPDGATYQWWYGDFTPQAGVWYHLTVVWETNIIPKFYIDGQQVPTVRSGTVSQIYNNAGAPLDIGRSTYAGRYLDGLLDEIRLSNTARTAAWIITSYNNQYAPASFYTIGNEETLPQEPFISDPSPTHLTTNVSVSFSELSFDLTDFQGDLMNYTVTISPDIGSGSGTNVPNGRYTVSVSGLEHSTTYTWQINVTDGTHWVNMTYIFTTEAQIELLVDSEFDDSADSADLRADGPGQDWYESRNDDPSLLTLDESDVGGDATKKAKLSESTSGNAYLTQEFSSPQTGVFSVQWDIYVDSIVDISAPDRAGWMLIGDNIGGTNGPNSENNERFVYMAFFKNTGGTEGMMDLVARDRDDGWTSFTTIATGLNLKQWYTIKVVCDLDADTYDVYVDGVFMDTVTSRLLKDSVTHISFAQWNDGAGTFYIDNVFAPAQDRYRLTINIDGGGAVTMDPAEATYAEGIEVALTATPDGGWTFSGWSGDLVSTDNPATLIMDGDKTVTVTFTQVQLLMDSEFDDSADSADLRDNGVGQDWYESRNDDPTLLTLNETDIGGNTGKKAALENYGISKNAYLTQEFSSAQSGTFTVSFDIYIDRIEDSGDYDRSGFLYIGDDSVSSSNPPTGTSNERFVFMAFYDSTPGDTGNDLEIRARTSSTQSYSTTSQWTSVATGLSYDTWYTIKIVINVTDGTYDVYVDDVLVGDDIPKYSGYASSSVTHISFSADSDGRGDFYVDNVTATTEN